MGLSDTLNLMRAPSLEAEPGAKCISNCTGCLHDAGAPCSHHYTLFPTPNCRSAAAGAWWGCDSGAPAPSLARQPTQPAASADSNLTPCLHLSCLAAAPCFTLRKKQNGAGPHFILFIPSRATHFLLAFHSPSFFLFRHESSGISSLINVV